MSNAEMMHVFGAFKTARGAEYAADQLAAQGIPKQAIGVLMSDKATKRMATIEKHTRAPEGVAAGGVAGGVLGALMAGFTSVAALAVPGVGLLAAGPLVSVLAGVGAGATAGGAIGGIIGLGLAEHEARLYDEFLKEDGVLVSVSTNDKTMRQLAARVFKDCGAVQLAVSRGRTAHL